METSFATARALMHLFAQSRRGRRGHRPPAMQVRRHFQATRRVLFPMALLLAAMHSAIPSARAASSAPTRDQALDSHTWQDRLLLVFAPDAASHPLAEQRKIVETEQRQFADRNLVAVEVVGNQVTGASDQAADLRKRFHVSSQDFKALLIGKDSGVKLSANEPLSAQQLRQTIDAMPMRRDEMAKQHSD